MFLYELKTYPQAKHDGNKFKHVDVLIHVYKPILTTYVSLEFFSA